MRRGHRLQRRAVRRPQRVLQRDRGAVHRRPRPPAHGHLGAGRGGPRGHGPECRRGPGAGDVHPRVCAGDGQNAEPRGAAVGGGGPAAEQQGPPVGGGQGLHCAEPGLGGGGEEVEVSCGDRRWGAGPTARTRRWQWGEARVRCDRRTRRPFRPRGATDAHAPAEGVRTGCRSLRRRVHDRRATRRL